MKIKKYLLGILMAMGCSTAFAYDTRIDGEFHGWDGETIYKLADGHIIQQAHYHYHYHYAYNPIVHIFRDNGEYVILIEGDNEAPLPIKILK